MPLYEYQCESCEQRFEVIQRFSDPPVAVCPSCGGVVRKLPSSPAIQFKGTGWYITDYARKQSGAPTDGKGSGETAAKADGAGKAEKPERADKEGAAKSTSSSTSDTTSSSPANTPKD